jgi:heme-degrading monooxygenase HmoA
MVIETVRGGNVIARIWRGWTTREDADGYEGHLKPELLPGLSNVQGFRGSYLLRRVEGEEVEFVTIILWDSIEAVRAVTGEDHERAVIPEERKKYLKRFEERAVHFEVVATQ